MTEDLEFAGYTYRPNKACLTCEHVFARTAEIKVIAHDSDGLIQCLCGESNHTAKQGKMIGLALLIDRLPGPIELPVLMPGEWAEKRSYGIWTVSEIENEQRRSRPL
ncbi:MAG: hypothetical protein ACR2RE_22560 [Geminicoccaceae bacterium]